MDVGGQTALVDTKINLICKLGPFIFKLGDGHYGIKVAPDIDTCLFVKFNLSKPGVAEQ